MGDPAALYNRTHRSRSRSCVVPSTPIRAAVQCGGCGASFPTLAASPVSARRFRSGCGCSARHRRCLPRLRLSASRRGWAALIPRESPGSRADLDRDPVRRRPRRSVGSSPHLSRCGPPCLAGRLPGHRHYSDAALLRLTAPTSASADNAALAASGCGDHSTASREPHEESS